MRLREFIRQNRAELADGIGRRLSHVPKTATCYCPHNGTDHYHERPKLTDKDLREWVLNDEPLYRWAQSEGVPV